MLRLSGHGAVVRIARELFALAALGLLVSLVPASDVVVADTGPPQTVLAPIQPGWGVRQSLGDVGIAVTQARIWLSAQPGGGNVRAEIMLIAGETGQPIRQAATTAIERPSPIPDVIAFDPYDPSITHDLYLQISVLPTDTNFIAIGASGQTGQPPTLNREPLALTGPLAFDLGGRASGFRMALVGGASERARAVAAIVALIIAVGAPVAAAGAIGLARILGRARRASIRGAERAAGTALRVSRGAAAVLARARTRIARSTALGRLRNSPGPAGRVFRAARRSGSRFPSGPSPQPRPGPAPELDLPALGAPARRPPLYPWLIAAFSPLHLYSSNVHLFHLSNVLAVVGVVLLGVSLSVGVLYAVVRDWWRAALATTVGGVAMLLYGRVFDALGVKADHRVLLPIFAVAATAIAVQALRRPGLSRAVAPGLNGVGAVLLVVVVGTIVVQGAQSASAATPARADTAVRVVTPGPRAAVRTLGDAPDIYYILLDQYPRADVLADQFKFDNSSFAGGLEDRGFYLPPDAASNYPSTNTSIPSSLDMAYVNDVITNPVAAVANLKDIAENHALGKVLRGLGYSYIHISSGWFFTFKNNGADVVVDFTAAGTRYTSGASLVKDSLPPTGRYAPVFLRTTALRPFLPAYFNIGAEGTSLPWWHPDRVLATFDFLQQVADRRGPKFTFVHVVKPHWPFSFDRVGNVSMQPNGFSPETLPAESAGGDPYLEQIQFINTLVLETVDQIVSRSARPPLIVIHSDHGVDPVLTRNHILMAILTPTHDADTIMYPSITSVNIFRVLLDHYFDLGLGRLPDRTYGLRADHTDAYDYYELPRALGR